MEDSLVKMVDKSGAACHCWLGADGDLARNRHVALDNLLIEIFGNGLDAAYPADLRAVVLREGRIVASAGAIARRWEVRNRRFAGMLVGYVCSHPAERGGGYAGMALESLMSAMLRQKVALGILHCAANLLPFYGRYGWQKINDAAYYDESDGRFRLDPDPVMAWPDNQPPLLQALSQDAPFPLGFDW